MRAHIEAAWERGEVDVWIVSDRGTLRLDLPGSVIRMPRWEPQTERGVRPDPTFSLPEDAFRALAAAANEKAMGPQTADAVADARATRDRLLTMVEKLAQ